MKKFVIFTLLIPIVIIFAVFFAAKSAPDYSENRQTIEDEQVKKDLKELVKNYKSEMVKASNDGSVGDIEKYLVKNHTYRNVRAYINQFQSNGYGNKMELMEQKIEDVFYYYLDDVPIYCVDVVEKVRIIENDVEEIEEDVLRYEVIKHEGEYKIESIIRR